MSPAKPLGKESDRQEWSGNRIALAIPSRNAFAEQGMANINHHIQSNAFAAQALTARSNTITTRHPALRPRGLSEASTLIRHQQDRRVVTPCLQDAINLMEAQKRSEAVDRRDRVVAALEESGKTFSKPNTPAKRSIKDVLITPMSNWVRRGVKKDRTPQAHASNISRNNTDVVRTSLAPPPVPETFVPMPVPHLGEGPPPTPPAKNTPPVIQQSDPASEGTIRLAYPTLRRTRSNDELRYRLDEETGGYLPVFNGSPVRSHTPGTPSTVSSTISTPTRPARWLAPDVYKPRHLGSFYNSLSSRHAAPSATARSVLTPGLGVQSRLSPAAHLRHMTGSISNARSTFQLRSVTTTIPENKDITTTDQIQEQDTIAPLRIKTSEARRADYIDQVRRGTAFRTAAAHKDHMQDSEGVRRASPVGNAIAMIEQRVVEVERVIGGVETQLSSQIRYIDNEIEHRLHEVDGESLHPYDQSEHHYEATGERLEAVDQHIDADDQEKDTAEHRSQILAGKLQELHRSLETVKTAMTAMNIALPEQIDALLEAKISKHQSSESQELTDARKLLTAVKGMLEINGVEVQKLNEKLQTVDANAAEGQAKAGAWGDQLAEYLKLAKNVHEKVLNLERWYREDRVRTLNVQNTLDSVLDRMKRVETDLNTLKHCHKSIDQMYIRVSAMDEMWTTQTTGEMVFPWRVANQAASTTRVVSADSQSTTAASSSTASRSTSVKKKKSKKTAQNDASSAASPSSAPAVATATHPRHGTTMPHNMPAQHLPAAFPPQADGQLPGLDRPMFKRWRNADLPLNYEAFFGLMVDMQERLHVLEQNQKTVLEAHRAPHQAEDKAVAAPRVPVLSQTTIDMVRAAATAAYKCTSQDS